MLSWRVEDINELVLDVLSSTISIVGSNGFS